MYSKPRWLRRWRRSWDALRVGIRRMAGAGYVRLALRHQVELLLHRFHLLAEFRELFVLSTFTLGRRGFRARHRSGRERRPGLQRLLEELHVALRLFLEGGHGRRRAERAG